jgi:hypothetical protein
MGRIPTQQLASPRKESFPAEGALAVVHQALRSSSLLPSKPLLTILRSSAKCVNRLSGGEVLVRSEEAGFCSHPVLAAGNDPVKWQNPKRVREV